MKQLFSSDKINVAGFVQAMRIGEWLGDEPYLMVRLLDGALPWSKKLLMHLPDPMGTVDITAKSMKGKMSTGQVDISCSHASFETIAQAIADSTRILVVEDILDSGRTIQAVYDRFFSFQNVDRILFGVLVSKQNLIDLKGRSYITLNGKRVPLQAAFTIQPDVFVVGMGMDFNGKYRELDHLAELTDNDIALAAEGE